MSNGKDWSIGRTVRFICNCIAVNNFGYLMNLACYTSLNACNASFKDSQSHLSLDYRYRHDVQKCPRGYGDHSDLNSDQTNHDNKNLSYD